ncbi:MAG: glycosyltransferase [Spirochaetaceae bacterium]|jgi:glycosyltransferase involved in cell wall biosynthesis|nr:glycosyltransferase [Spirochaetaceae bacterium]
MKIAIFTDAYWPRVNGVTVSIDAFSHALLRLGHKVLIVCAAYPDTMGLKRISSDQTETPELQPEIIQVPSFTFVLSKEDRVAHFHKVFWVAKQIGTFAPDIIHLNTEFMLAKFGFYCARHYKIPVVYTFHTLWEEYGGNYFYMFPLPFVKFIARNIIKYMLKRTDVIIAPTTQVAELIKKYKIKKQTFLLPTGIDPKYLDFTQLQKDSFKRRFEQIHPVLAHKKILIFAGRITKEKNIDFLLHILPRIIEKRDDVVLLIIGNGPYHDELMQTSEKLGLQDHCVFTGYLDRVDLGLTYAMSHIFVFPSLTETQGLVTVEAMYSGIPVVAIGSMGTIMVMGGDNGGFMVHNDPGEFTDKVLALLEDPELYKRKVYDAKEHAQNWLIDTMAVKLINVYQKTLDSYKKK